MGNWATGLMLPDIPRYYTALAEWLACMLCIVQIPRRHSSLHTGLITAGFLLFQCVFLMNTDNQTGLRWIVCMLIAVGAMLLLLYLCNVGSWMDAGFRAVEAFVLAELAASFGWQLYCYTYYALNLTAAAVSALILAFSYVLVFGVMYLLTHRLLHREEDIAVTGRELALSAIIGASIFLVSNLSFTFLNTPFSSSYSSDIFTIRTLMDLGGVAILFAYHIQRRNMHIQYELSQMSSMLEHQYLQFQQSKETLDLINHKYHDLKHQILALRAEEDQTKRSGYLDAMEQSIRIYETENRTGNKVLDIILTSKSVNCMNNGISFTSVVDGTLLDFMDAMDICSIFGNALDNAIAFEKTIPEEEKRMIHLSVFSQKSFLIIRCENYFEGTLHMENNLPRTTNPNHAYHGYGLKSIRSIARKYGGEMAISTANSCFSLKLLIPLPH